MLDLLLLKYYLLRFELTKKKVNENLKKEKIIKKPNKTLGLEYSI